MTFNVVKTWTEYLNRLAGMVIGLSVMVTAGIAIRVRRDIPVRTLVMALAVCALVGFEGWLGSIVVASVLTPWVITAHMVAAIVIVVILTRCLASISESVRPVSPRAVWWGVCVVVGIQFALGSQLREILDHHITIGLDLIGMLYWVHRSLSWAVVLGALWVGYYWNRSGRSDLAYILVGIVVMQMVTGAIFSWIGVLSWLRPIHLVLAAVTIATLTYGYPEPSYRSAR